MKNSGHCEEQKCCRKGGKQENVSYERQLEIFSEIEGKCFQTEQYKEAGERAQKVLLTKFLKNNFSEFKTDQQPTRKYWRWITSVSKIENGEICTDKLRGKLYGEIVEAKVAELFMRTELVANLSNVCEVFKKLVEIEFKNDSMKLNKLRDHIISTSFVKEFCSRHGIVFAKGSVNRYYVKEWFW
jgi:hypothetical protein